MTTITEADFIRTLHAVTRDKYPIPLHLTDNERALLRIGLRLAVPHLGTRELRNDIREYAHSDLVALSPDRLFQVVTALQHVKPVRGLFTRFTVEQHTALMGIAWKLTDLVVARHPALAEVIETGWKGIA